MFFGAFIKSIIIIVVIFQSYDEYKQNQTNFTITLTMATYGEITKMIITSISHTLQYIHDMNIIYIYIYYKQQTQL